MAGYNRNMLQSAVVKYEPRQGRRSRGCEVDAADDEGYTPLMRAAHMSDIVMVEGLINYGASVNALTPWPQCQNALHIILKLYSVGYVKSEKNILQK